jgi:hypothetical protein
LQAAAAVVCPLEQFYAERAEYKERPFFALRSDPIRPDPAPPPTVVAVVRP